MAWRPGTYYGSVDDRLFIFSVQPLPAKLDSPSAHSSGPWVYNWHQRGPAAFAKHLAPPHVEIYGRNLFLLIRTRSWLDLDYRFRFDCFQWHSDQCCFPSGLPAPNICVELYEPCPKSIRGHLTVRTVSRLGRIFQTWELWAALYSFNQPY